MTTLLTTREERWRAHLKACTSCREEMGRVLLITGATGETTLPDISRMCATGASWLLKPGAA